MHINTLSARLDQKLIEVDHRLDKLSQQLAQTADATKQQQIQADLAALALTKDKLLKSRDLAWRAHRLQQQSGEAQTLRRKQRLGLVLCIFSALGLLVLVGIFGWLELR
jgi:hypothetical protein